MINALLCADADAVIGAEPGKPSPDRLTLRSGYWHRDLGTRVAPPWPRRGDRGGPAPGLFGNAAARITRRT